MVSNSLCCCILWSVTVRNLRITDQVDDKSIMINTFAASTVLPLRTMRTKKLMILAKSPTRQVSGSPRCRRRSRTAVEDEEDEKKDKPQRKKRSHFITQSRYLYALLSSARTIDL